MLRTISTITIIKMSTSQKESKADSNSTKSIHFQIPLPTRPIPVQSIPDHLGENSLSWLPLRSGRSNNDDTGTTSVNKYGYTPEVSMHLSRGHNVVDELGADIRSTNQPEIKQKLVMFVMIPGLCAAAIYNLRGVESAYYKSISSCVSIISAAFVVYWFYLIETASQLHRIRIVTSRFEPFYGNMVFPTQIRHYPSRPIKSVSEIIALRGSSAHIFFLSTTVAGACISATAIISHWLDLQQHAHLSNQETTLDYLEQALAICSVFALPMVAHFELDVHTPCLMFMHYTGVLCHVCSVWPFAIQSGFSVPSIGIIVVSYVSFASWLILARFYPADLSKAYKVRMSDVKMKESVHLMSVHCLVAQATGTTGCLVACCLYLWNIREVSD